MKTKKPLATLSLDLDNQWSYMKTHGDAGWETFPSYLDIVVPRVLHFLKERSLTITFFIVGQDAALAKNAVALKSITAAGHEVGNHSFHHEPWLHLYSEAELEDELARAETHIEQATGEKPLGFRGPGFSLSETTLQVLLRRGYLYDASTFPTFLGPLARAYYFMQMRGELSEEERRKRQALFGSFRDGFRPLKPYRWRVGDGALMEVPVTTMPGFKVPFHVSYLLYLSGFSTPLALLYFTMAMQLCRLTGVEPSLLLHPLDFMGCDDVQELAFFPGMGLQSDRKVAVVAKVLNIMAKYYTILPLQRYVETVPASSRLPVLTPHFRF